MSAGQMRERVSFRSQSRVQRADGGYDTTVATVVTRWASVRPVAGAEGEQAGRQFGATTYMIEIWAGDKPSGLTTDYVLRWETAPGGAVDFNIRAIRQSSLRPLALEIVAEKGAVL